MRILFIGNSHTYLHYMPRMVSALAEDRGQKAYTHQSVGEGAGLEWHRNRPETSELISEGGWSHVILQERSRGPLEDRPSMHRHARLLDKKVQEKGCRTVFFMTWAARGQTRDQETIAEAYRDIALECGSMLAPVGRSWQLALGHKGCPDLFHKDGRHASKAGAYLTACVFYALLCGDPMGLSHSIVRDGHMLVDLREKEARLLQTAAGRSVSLHGLT